MKGFLLAPLVLWPFAKLIALAYLLAVGSCAHQREPAPTPQPSSGIEACLPDNAEALAGSCGQLRIADADGGYFCALCHLDRGCIDKKSFSYCVGAFGCDDPRCAKR